LKDSPSEGWKLKFAAFGAVYGNYFQALGIPLIAGSTFTDEDRADSPLVVVVNQSMARHSWPRQNPIGKRVRVGNPQKKLPWAIVIGIVGDTRIGGRDQGRNDRWYASTFSPPFSMDRRRRRQARRILVLSAGFVYSVCVWFIFGVALISSRNFRILASEFDKYFIRVPGNLNHPSMFASF